MPHAAGHDEAEHAMTHDKSERPHALIFQLCADRGPVVIPS